MRPRATKISAGFYQIGERFMIRRQRRLETSRGEWEVRDTQGTGTTEKTKSSALTWIQAKLAAEERRRVEAFAQALPGKRPR